MLTKTTELSIQSVSVGYFVEGLKVYNLPELQTETEGTIILILQFSLHSQGSEV